MAQAEHKVVLDGAEVMIRVTEVDDTLEYYIESDSARFFEIFKEKGLFLTKDDPGKDTHIIELLQPPHQTDAGLILAAARSLM